MYRVDGTKDTYLSSQAECENLRDVDLLIIDLINRGLEIKRIFGVNGPGGGSACNQRNRNVNA